MASAMEKAFLTFEIFEMILLELNGYDILVKYQRVSKLWRATIANSSRLQWRLYLKAIPGSPSDVESATAIRYTRNPLIESRSPSLIKFAMKDGKLPTFARRLRSMSAWYQYAGWRRMFVSQPPITKLHWSITQAYPIRSTWPRVPGILAKFHFPEGLRMGDYFDLVNGAGHTRAIKWPLVAKNGIFYQTGYPLKWAAWLRDQEVEASMECAMFVEQFVLERPDDRPVADRDYLNLQRFHPNLRCLEVSQVLYQGENSDGMTFEQIDGEEAMDIFLHNVLPTDEETHSLPYKTSND
ncbi:hypothetical protein F5Y04DRAFT_279715 [Hypomontagnella monticulosa]|nr:hypothetical protein F5Y04DRAFT_279715 [Hypomontagnella monticulosa]